MKASAGTLSVLFYRQGSAPERISLGGELKSGGSGAVFPIVGLEDLIAKVYHPSILNSQRHELEARIQAMLERPPALPPPVKPVGSQIQGDIVQIAWPSALLKDAQGQFMGFAMPMIDLDQTIELECVLLSKQAKAMHLKHELPHKLLLAYNLAVVVHEVHQKGHAIVDLKPANLKFYRHELYMAVIDCDGFCINAGDQVLDAPQVTGDYLAPEYQSRRVAQPRKQDEFALATIIFQLLNESTHPYTARPLDSLIPHAREDLIAGGFYPYGLKPHPRVKPHVASTHQLWPLEIRHLFDRAFANSSIDRPSPNEWMNLLRTYVDPKHGALDRCDAGHWKFSGQACMQCFRDEVRNGLPPTSGKGIGQRTASNIGQEVGRQIVQGILAQGKPSAASKQSVPNPALAIPPQTQNSVLAHVTVSATTKHTVPTHVVATPSLSQSSVLSQATAYVAPVQPASPLATATSPQSQPSVSAQSQVAPPQVQAKQARPKAFLAPLLFAGMAAFVGYQLLASNEASTILDRVRGVGSTEELASSDTSYQKVKGQAMASGKDILRPYFGLTFGVKNGVDGIYIETVNPTGPAFKAGLKSGDILLAISGYQVASRDDLKRMFENELPKAGLDLDIQRGSKRLRKNLGYELLPQEEWERKSLPTVPR